MPKKTLFKVRISTKIVIALLTSVIILFGLGALAIVFPQVAQVLVAVPFLLIGIVLLILAIKLLQMRKKTHKMMQHLKFWE